MWILRASDRNPFAHVAKALINQYANKRSQRATWAVHFQLARAATATAAGGVMAYLIV